MTSHKTHQALLSMLNAEKIFLFHNQTPLTFKRHKYISPARLIQIRFTGDSPFIRTRLNQNCLLSEVFSKPYLNSTVVFFCTFNSQFGQFALFCLFLFARITCETAGKCTGSISKAGPALCPFFLSCSWVTLGVTMQQLLFTYFRVIYNLNAKTVWSLLALCKGIIHPRAISCSGIITTGLPW